MMLSAVFIAAVIILEAGPVYNLFMADFHGRALSLLEWVWIIGSFTVAFILSMLAVIIPMKFGERRLSSHLI
jgi:ABC-2 type transport system permease protein